MMENGDNRLPQTRTKEIDQIYGYEDEEKARNFLQMLLQYLKEQKERDAQKLRTNTSI